MTKPTGIRLASLHVVALLMLLALVPMACGDDDTDQAPGLANPASVYCEEQGGEVAIERDDEGNETGICVLPDGTRVDEWEYYRANNEADTTEE